MECTVPVEVHLSTEHADVGSLERTVSAALGTWSRYWAERFAALLRPWPSPA